MGVFFYAAATALRLARFHLVSGVDTQYFRGLPCPTAAGMVATLVWWTVLPPASNSAIVFVLLFIIALALLMVSNVRYPSLKGINFTGRIPLMYAIVVIVITALILVHPPALLFLSGTAYLIGGIAHTLWRRYRLRTK